MATDYSKKTNAELVEILKSRSLPHAGKKADMVARLQEDDSKKATAPAKTDNAEDVIDWEDDEVPAAAKPAEDAAAAEDSGAAKADESKAEAETEAKGAPASQEEGSEGTVTAAPETASQAEEKPTAPSYSMGLSVTDMEEELKKRKARAEKFGITEDSQAAIDEAEKKLQRAKRFGSGAEAPSTTGAAGVSRLDQALPDEKSRKRGRVENDQGARGGKKRNFNGRNNFRQRGRGNRDQGQRQGQGQGQGGQKRGSGNTKEINWSENDKAAMDARKKRFATSA